MEDLVVVGDVIRRSDSARTAGHGLKHIDKQVVVTACGILKEKNAVDWVHSFPSRHFPKAKNVVIGRVCEVGKGRWNVEIQANRYAVLELSSVDVPDRLQRRRAGADELNMRDYLVEGDLISAELVDVRGGYVLNAGNSLRMAHRTKFGKLQRGQLVKVKPYLIKEMRPHFYERDGARIIFGCNGYVWIGDGDTDGGGSGVSVSKREVICRLANAVRVLSSLPSAVSFESVVAMYEMSITAGVDIKNMLSNTFVQQAYPLTKL